MERNASLAGGNGWSKRLNCERLMAQVPPTEAGSSEIWVREGDLFGRIVLRDDIRPQARKVVEDLRDAGLHSVVLTGDRKGAAEHLKIGAGNR